MLGNPIGIYILKYGDLRYETANHFVGDLAGFVWDFSQSCNKSEESSGGAAAVVENGEESVLIRLSANSEQSFSPGQATLAGVGIQVSAAALIEPVDVLIKRGTSLVNPYINETYELESALNIVASGPAIEFRPLSPVNLQTEISLTLPKGDEVDASSTNLAVLYKGVDEEGYWHSAIIGAAYIGNGGAVASLQTKYFGRYQVVQLDANLNNSQDFVSVGSGPWYGVEFDLYSQFANPVDGDPDHALFVFDSQGSMKFAESNQVRISPPPSFDFEALETDYPSVFDISGDVQVSLALFTNDFDHGFWFDFRTNESLMTVRTLQREIQETLPSDALDLAAFAGEFIGTTATTSAAGLAQKLDVAYNGDTLTVVAENGGISLSGSLKQEAIETAQFTIADNTIAQSLGFFSGTVTIGGVAQKAFLFPTLNRKGFGIVVCESDLANSCPVGDGTGTYDAQSMFFGVFSKN